MWSMCKTYGRAELWHPIPVPGGNENSSNDFSVLLGRIVGFNSAEHLLSWREEWRIKVERIISMSSVTVINMTTIKTSYFNSISLLILLFFPLLKTENKPEEWWFLFLGDHPDSIIHLIRHNSVLIFKIYTYGDFIFICPSVVATFAGFQQCC